jgi:hypothetical protein
MRRLLSQAANAAVKTKGSIFENARREAIVAAVEAGVRSFEAAERARDAHGMLTRTRGSRIAGRLALADQ